MAKSKTTTSAQKPTLSICIPTYNRANLLRDVLENYRKILANPSIADKVEVCISDNASTDGTISVLREFAKKGGFCLSYRKNARNVGFDRNAIQAMRMANGRFVHLVSDEEHYNESVLLDLVVRLGRNECDCVFVNQTLFPGVSEKDIARLGREPLYAISHKKFYRMFVCLFSLIISKSSMDAFFRGYKVEEFYGTLFSFAPLYIHALRGCTRMHVLREWHCRMPHIAYKAHLPHDYARTFDYLFFQMIRECAKQGIIKRQELESFKRKIFLWHVVRGMLLYRTYIYPEIYSMEGKKTADYYWKIRDEFGFGTVGRAAFGALISLVYNPYVPYHWLYRAYYFIKKNILRDLQVKDRFEIYDQILFKKKERFELGMDRY